MVKVKKPIDMSKVKPEEMMKYEIAKELGLFDRVLENGWGSLSAKETGRIGGIMTRKKKEEERKKRGSL
ncbi:MAG: small, acid-soluble spore protein, alpha/beta type [Clostridiales bacterium]|nr:small, acid-soluble spore protein, alpha/beta type [Clostridiales bacterium]